MVLPLPITDPITEQENTAAAKVRVTEDLHTEEIQKLKYSLNPMQLIEHLHTHDMREGDRWRKAIVNIRMTNEKIREDLDSLGNKMDGMNNESFNFIDRRDKKKIDAEEADTEERIKHMEEQRKKKQTVKPTLKIVNTGKLHNFEPHNSPRDLNNYQELQDLAHRFKTAIQTKNCFVLRECIHQVEQMQESDKEARIKIENADNHLSTSEALFEEYVEWGKMLIRKQEEMIAKNDAEKGIKKVYDRSVNKIVVRLFEKNVAGKMQIIDPASNYEGSTQDESQKSSKSSLATDPEYDSEVSSEDEKPVLITDKVFDRLKVVPKHKAFQDEPNYRLQF